MDKAITRWWRGLWADGRMLRERQQGQTLIIIVFAFIGILAFIGLGIDLAVVYTERVKVARAADAAALAAASELPLEGAAHMRALSYLQENGYDHTITSTVRTVIDGTGVSGPPEEDATTTIWIDTAYAQDDYQLNTSDRVKVRVRQEIFMMFMQFIGFRHFPVEATAEAENISNVDTVIVYDKSGSMEFDTLCYGCWEAVDGQMYPDGNIFPLHWSDTTTMTADHCASECEEDDYENYNAYYEYNDCNYRHRTYTDRYWIVIEAEEYSRLSVDYHRWQYQPYMSYWVVQRNDYNESWGQNVNAYGRDARGAYLSHHPFYVGSAYLAVNCTLDAVVNGYCRYGVSGGPFSVPQADYDFYAPVGDTYYYWIRGQGGQNSYSNNHVFWGLGSYSAADEEDGFNRGPGYDGAVSSRWDWRCLGSSYLPAGNHTLKLWAGGAGFDVDRIVVTTYNPSGECGNDSSPPGSPDNYPANNGRTDWACNSCDPRFAGRPGGQTPPDPYRPDCSMGDLRSDDIYDDEQPIRDALEAAKNFVARLDPRFDQIGYVRYDSRSEIANELECLRRLGPDDCTAQVITDTVLYELDTTYAGGSTNIAEGIKHGIEVLSTVSGHYGRPGAAHVMVLMTDGEANTYNGCDPACDDEDLWPEDDEPAKDCVIWYARQARDNGIVIYTISLGWSADLLLMQEVADLTGGFHRWAPSSDKLNAIFDELFERIFLRLIH